VTAHDVALGRDELTNRELGSDFGADFYDFAGEFVPHDQRRSNPTLRPLVPVGNVEIRSTDAGVMHADDDIL
jgi:hypothetical protein